MFRAHVLIIRRSKLHYTASGIITPIGGRLVHQTATCRCDDTRGCVMQFWPPGDEHMCSKHVETWNKLIVKQKFCASSWLITEIIILSCTVSKTSKKCFRWFFRPPPGTQNCTYSVRYLSNRCCYLPLAWLVAGRSICQTNTWRCMCSFELLMLEGKPVWNM